MSPRFAIYYAPPAGSELEAFGRRWLGRDPVTGDGVERAPIEGLDPAELARITRPARHYGFHGTLKAPFALEPGRHATDLRAAARDFAASRVAFEAPPLQLAKLSRWLALTPKASSPALDRLAADCVRAFEPFRAQPSAAELERRRQSGLTPRQDRHLTAFGYPYVFEDFHFHMTLAGPLDEARLDRLYRTLLPMIGPFPLVVDAIAIYRQPRRDEPFVETARLPFAGRTV